jgi:hypothetical protein
MLLRSEYLDHKGTSTRCSFRKKLLAVEILSEKRGFSCSVKHLFNNNSKKLHGTINFQRERSRVSAFLTVRVKKLRSINHFVGGKRGRRRLRGKSIKTSYGIKKLVEGMTGRYD